MKTFAEINTGIAYIQDGGVYFQVLNEDGTDWDEAATVAAYQAWLAAQPK
jgi:hypothetical protein